MPTSIPGSNVGRFYQSQRASLLGGASITEKKMFGTTALCAGRKVFMPRLAQEARAFAGG
jgi:hypothetical protein